MPKRPSSPLLFPGITSVLIVVLYLSIAFFAHRHTAQQSKIAYFKDKEASRFKLKNETFEISKAIDALMRRLGREFATSFSPERASQIQKEAAQHPWFWQVVHINFQRGLLWPRLPWAMNDDPLAWTASERQKSCESFMQSTATMQVGHAMRLASGARLLRRFPKCEIFSWIRVALFQDLFAKAQLETLHNQTTLSHQLIMRTQGKHNIILIRPSKVGMIGVVLKKDLPFSFGHPKQASSRPGYRLVATSEPINSTYTLSIPLSGALTGFSIRTTQPSPEAGSPWLLFLFGVGFFFVVISIAFVLAGIVKREAWLKQREELFYLIAHELKTPISAQQGMLETLLSHELEQPKLAEYKQALYKEGHRLQQLVTNLLELGRSQRLQTEEVLDLTGLCRELLESVEWQAEEKDIELQCDEHRLFFVRMDRFSLELALRNLLDNAIRYTPHQHAVRLSFLASPQRVTLQIANSGAMISEQTQAVLFEPFARGENRQEQGSGLGLFLSKRITEQHRGRLVLQKSDAQETIFELTLPRASEERSA